MENEQTGKKDMLVDMMQHQTELEEQTYMNAFGIGLEGLTKIDICQLTKDTSYFVTEELHEMTRELPFMKHWKRYAPTEEQYAEMLEKAKKEYIDAMHFMLNIAVLLGLSADDIYKLYMEKNKINHERQDNGY